MDRERRGCGQKNRICAYAHGYANHFPVRAIASRLVSSLSVSFSLSTPQTLLQTGTTHSPYSLAVARVPTAEQLASFFPLATSTFLCCSYFHNILDYTIPPSTDCPPMFHVAAVLVSVFPTTQRQNLYVLLSLRTFVTVYSLCFLPPPPVLDDDVHCSSTPRVACLTPVAYTYVHMCAYIHTIIHRYREGLLFLFSDHVLSLECVRECICGHGSGNSACNRPDCILTGLGFGSAGSTYRFIHLLSGFTS